MCWPQKWIPEHDAIVHISTQIEPSRIIEILTIVNIWRKLNMQTKLYTLLCIKKKDAPTI